MDNIFKQYSTSWVIRLFLNFQYTEKFIDLFDIENVTISSSEYEASSKFESADTDIWMVEIYYNNESEYLVIEKTIDKAKILFNIDIEFTKEQLQDKDWVSEVQKFFKAFTIAKFFVYSSYHAESIPEDKFPIMIDAARAFGTGEHETTKGCLIAISDLSKKYSFTNMLDVGCGTAILAIAMAKIWQNNVIAVDLDDEAVRIAEENIKKNNVDNYIKVAVSDGYSSDIVKQSSKFDLITANILAKPLIDLAPELYNNLLDGGFAIISGLLEYQEDEVLEAHLTQKLKLIKIIRKNNWSTILLSK